MTLQLGVGRIPTVRHDIAFRAHAICVTIVIELLCHIPGTNLPQRLITVMRQSVVTVNGNIFQRESVGFFLRRSRSNHIFHDDLGRNRETIVGCLVTDYISIHRVLATRNMLLYTSLGFFLYTG